MQMSASPPRTDGESARSFAPQLSMARCAQAGGEWQYVPHPATPLQMACAASAQSCLEVTQQDALRAPTAEQLKALTALPLAMARASRVRGSRRSGGRVPAAVKAAMVNRVYNPQAGRPMPSLRSPLQPYVLTLEGATTLFTTSTVAAVFAGKAFALSDFNYAALATVFDQYRFMQIEAWIDPGILMSDSVASTPFYTTVDLDDANAPTGQAEVVNHAACVSSQTGTAHYHRWAPYMAIAAYSGAFTSYVSSKATWIDVASPGVQHYGIKSAVPFADGVARAYTLTFRATIEFRGADI